MEQSRLEKYKEYRNSAIKDDAPLADLTFASEGISVSEKPSFRTTSTLPIDEVMKKIDENSKDVVFLRKQKTKFILKILFTVLGIIALLAIMIGFGIYLWRN